MNKIMFPFECIFGCGVFKTKKEFRDHFITEIHRHNVERKNGN